MYYTILMKFRLILCCVLFVKRLGISRFVLHFWLLFYLFEGLIFIPPNNLAFARAKVGVRGRGVGGPQGKRTLLCLLEFFENL